MLFDFLFPKECLACGKKGSWLCSDCRHRLKTIRFQVCPVCSRATFLGKTHGLCLKKTPLDGLVCLFYYRSVVGRMIKGFKYSQLKELKVVLGEIIVVALGKNQVLSYWRKKGFLILPIPLFPARFIWRGFNQSQVLAQGVGEKLKLQVLAEEVLIRKRWTMAQARLQAEKRQRNLRNAFSVKDKEAIKGKRIILFDDVLTTGATLKEAAKVLKSAGAKEVWGLVVCR